MGPKLFSDPRQASVALQTNVMPMTPQMLEQARAAAWGVVRGGRASDRVAPRPARGGQAA